RSRHTRSKRDWSSDVCSSDHPAAILSWIIGAVIIIAIVLTYVELGTMFPESGGMSKYAQYSHGPMLGFIAAWANWISLVTLVPTIGRASCREREEDAKVRLQA